ncbi:glycosyltransferase [Paenibacillus sp. H1-7]|uniref:glycosyltransferase n=1 Tax=Paenibacillus sp. H1-7 TaxID=2282849 RepID=UPI001EF9A6C8|nr:glycosyltransferase [Paenibacillus sp. H1-7]
MINGQKTIVQINVTPNGSTGKIMYALQENAIKSGYRAISAYGRGVSQPDPSIKRIGRNIDTYMHVGLTRLFDRHGFGSKRATDRFLADLDKINPDIIHLHNIHGYYLNIKSLFGYIKSKNIPVVWTLHDCWAFTGHCAYFDFANCKKWETICEKCPQKKTYPSSLLLDNSKEAYSKKKALFSNVKNLTIVTPSIWLEKLVKKSFLKDYPVEVISNGIDLNLFKPTVSQNIKNKLGISDKQFVILGVAANFKEERKGINYFLEIARKLDTNFTIVLVGVTREQQSNMPQNVIGLRRTENINELIDLYSMADVFLNPTLEDNFPTVNLEAMACGTPVIAFDTGGVKEQIQEDCGEIIPKGDTKRMIESIIRIKSVGAANYSNACITRVKINYQQHDRFLEYINLYNKILES